MMNTDTDLIIVHDKTFAVTLSAVNKMVDFIRPTYGPASNKVIISKFTHSLTVDDGVQIARDFRLEDPAENAIVKLVREVAIKTNDRVKDGTTGALIMVQGQINEVSRMTHWNGRKIELELREAVKEVAKELRKNAVKVETKEDLRKVARISFDDPVISKLIADTYFKLGKDGLITTGFSSTDETTMDINDGIKTDTGYLSPYMVTNPDRMEVVFEKPKILVTDYRLTEAEDVMGILNKFAAKGIHNLVIIAENVEDRALATLVINHPNVMNPHTKKPGAVMSVAIAAPRGEDMEVALEDIAMMLGAKMISQSKGMDMKDVEIEDLGTAQQIIVRKDETIIVDPKGNKTDISVAVTSLRTAIEAEKDEKSKEALKKRLAQFENSVAVIKVGAPTQEELKAVKYKVDNAINAVKEAFNGGVVDGSGLALARIKTRSKIMNEALQYPSRQLRDNMGLDGDIDLDPKRVLNVVTGGVGEGLEVGVIDPVEVLIAGVESAVSITSMLITSHGILVEIPREDKK